MNVRAVWLDETSQDIIEYSLLIAFVTVLASAIFPFGGLGGMVAIIARVSAFLKQGADT